MPDKQQTGLAMWITGSCIVSVQGGAWAWGNQPNSLASVAADTEETPDA